MNELKLKYLTSHPLRENTKVIDILKIKDQFIVVRPQVVGVCRSDIKEILAERTVRSDFGHEIVGRVEMVSEQSKLKVGDTVVYWPEIKIKRTPGFGNLIFAEGDASEINQAFVKVENDIEPKRLVFCEPMSCAYHCVNRLLVSLGTSSFDSHKIAIIGAGNAGTLMGLIIKNLKGRVVFFNRGTERLQFLEKNRIFKTNELRSLQEMDRFNDLFDAVIVTTTFLNNELLTQAGQLVKQGHPIVLFGGTKSGLKMDHIDADIDNIRRTEKKELVVLHHNKRINLVGTYGSTLNDFKNVIKLLQDRDAFPVEKLTEFCITDDQLLRVLKKLSDGTHYNKIIVDYRDNV